MKSFNFLVSEPLNMLPIFGRFWPIWWIEKKIIVNDLIFDLANFNNIFVTSARRALFWASLEEFDFFAISKSS